MPIGVFAQDGECIAGAVDGSAAARRRDGHADVVSETRLATIVGIWVRPNVSSSHRPLLLREHQVQVLNRSAGCAFAKIIENRGQQDVPVFHVRKYA